MGQAEVLSNVYDEIVRYSQQTEFLYYNENVWIEDNLKVRRLAQNLTDLQLKEARTEIKKAHELEDVSESDKKEAEKWAEVYRNYALKYQDSQKITATLREVQPMVQIDIQLLDEDGYKLNTPNGTIDLKTKELKKHNPKDYCTKITSVSPSNMGRELFDEFLNVITCEDTELKEYLQYVAGMIAIGKVFHENLIIAYGGGKNGKSTFFNLIAKVLGDYSGYLSSEVLTNDCRKNKGPEYAELRGKRFVITTELEEDVYLNTSIVKKLCSTDSIYAEKKYKAPFSFEPTHTIVLYTNHLPNVRAFDEGIWRRLVVIPFNAVIKKENEIKNYTEYLYEKAGGAVLNWIMEGAYMYIKDNHKIEMPTVVKNAIESYRLENDWIGNYLSERCVVEKSLKQASGRLFADYREYAKSIGEPIKSNAFFNNALKGKGFVIRKGTKGSFVYGLQLCSEMPQFECEKVLSAVSMTDNDAEMQENDEVVF